MTRERIPKPVAPLQRAPEVAPQSRVPAQPVKPVRLPSTLEAKPATPAQLEIQRAQQLEVQRLADLEVQRAAIQRAHDDRFTQARASQTVWHTRGSKTLGVQRAVSEHARSARDARDTRAAFVAQRSSEHLKTLVAQRLGAAVCPALPVVQRQADLTLAHVADHFGSKATVQLARDPERLSSYAGFKNAGAGLVKNFRTPGSSHTIPQLAEAIQRFQEPMQRAAVEGAAYAAFGSHPTYPKQLQRALEERDSKLEVQRAAWQRELEPFAQRQALEEASGEGAAGMIEAARGSGQPLPAGVRAMLEAKWNTDLSKVRVHTDSRSSQISKKLNAKALTTGQDIFFGASTFNPTSLEGLQLIAHEAWHTVQQAGGLVQAGIDRSASLEVEAQFKGSDLSSRDLQTASSPAPQLNHRQSIPVKPTSPKLNVVQRDKAANHAPSPPFDVATWLVALQKATPETLPGVFRSAVAALTQAIKGGQTIGSSAAEQLGSAAGQRVWQLAKLAAGNAAGSPEKKKPKPTDVFGHKTHYDVLNALEDAVVSELTQTTRADAQKKTLPNMLEALRLSLVQAGRGMQDINLKANAGSENNTVKILITGFDPFGYDEKAKPEPYPESSREMHAGLWNPSGAIALALDGLRFQLKTGETVSVESAVIPVQQEFFDSGGVEALIRPRLGQADAVITISQGGETWVQLERVLAGTRTGDLRRPSEHGRRNRTPIQENGRSGPGLLSAHAPVERIAEQSGNGVQVGTTVTFRLSDTDRDKIIAFAQKKYGLTPTEVFESGSASGELRLGYDAARLSDATEAGKKQLLESIIAAMNRTDATRNPQNPLVTLFELEGATITATVLSGPGGDYYSNEVSYRANHLIDETPGASGTQSFHIHTPPAEDSVENAQDQARFRQDLLGKVRTILRVTAEQIANERRAGAPADQRAKPVKKAVQRSPTGGSQGLSNNPNVHLPHVSGSGAPLEASVQRQLEPHVGHDLSHVRIHTDAQAQKISASLDARAVTMGDNVLFGQGHFNPASREGLGLIAHESLHTVQQRRGIVASGLDADMGLEQQARTLETSVRSGSQPMVRGAKRSPVASGGRTGVVAVAQRAPDSSTQVKSAPKGTPINRTGGVIDAGGVNLRDQPNATGRIVTHLKAGATLTVQTELDGGWYKVTSSAGSGYAASHLVKLAPDKGAVLHQISAGQPAIGIAQRYYSSAVKPGEDLRFYVNVLHHVNPDAIPNPSGDNWTAAVTLKNYWVWIPSVTFAQTLRGVVKTGTRAGDAYDAIKENAAAMVKATIGQLPGGKEVLKTLAEIGSSGAKVLSNPGAFVTNFGKAVGQGFGQFSANLPKHLEDSVVSLFTGTMGGIELPKNWDATGIMHVGLQMVGGTPEQLEARLVSAVPGGMAAINAAGEAKNALTGIQKNGFAPTAMKYYGDGTALKETILGGVKSYVLNTVVKQGIIALGSLFIPGAGIIQAAIKLYETIKFIWDKFQDLANTAKAITASLTAIAAGDIASAVTKISASLVGALGLGVNFLARIAKLDGIVARVRALFDKIKAPIKAAMDKVIAWFKGLVKGRGAKPNASSNANTKPKDPDHDKKVAIGLAQIDLEEAKVDAKDNDGKLTRAQATQVAATIKRNNPIFTKIIVHYEVAKNEINYEWFASNGIRKSNRKPYTDDLEPAANEGTKANPFPLDWAKPASATYPKIFLGGTRTDHKSQNDLSQMVGKVDEFGVIVKEYAPHTRAVLPGGEAIGLTANYYLDVGTVIGPLASDGVKSAGGYLINDVLRRYGFRPDKDRLDGDHIHEMQLGGQNVLENLWPLDKSINRGSGSTIDKADVRLQDGRVIKVYQLRQFVKISGRNIYFSIRSVA